MKDVEDYAKYEKTRYKRKGYGLIFAILITIAFFLIGPEIVKKIFLKIYPGEDKVNPSYWALMYMYLLHILIFSTINIFYCVIYKSNMNFFEKYKINNEPWPWESDPDNWGKLLKETLVNLFINNVFMVPLSMIGHFLTGKSPYGLDKINLPSHLEIIWQIVFFMIMEDTCFYWSHRLLHWDRIYPYIHKQHHRYKNTISIASEYAHPIEFLFGNILCMNAGPILLGQKTHIITYTLWMLMRIGETCDGYCGYEFSWSPYRLLPFSGSSEYHNYHHLLYKGNYCSLFTFWDRICGTINPKYAKLHKKSD